MKALKTLKSRSGFTLIELLVVVAIIGILAAIAIPQFASYRQRGFDARANSDLRNAATSEEAFFATNSSYQTCSATAGGSGCNDPTLPGFSISDTVSIAMTPYTAGGQPAFSGTSRSESGSNKQFSYDSALGGMQ